MWVVRYALSKPPCRRDLSLLGPGRSLDKGLGGTVPEAACAPSNSMRMAGRTEHRCQPLGPSPWGWLRHPLPTTFPLPSVGITLTPSPTATATTTPLPTPTPSPTLTAELPLCGHPRGADGPVPQVRVPQVPAPQALRAGPDRCLHAMSLGSVPHPAALVRPSMLVLIHALRGNVTLVIETACRVEGRPPPSFRFTPPDAGTEHLLPLHCHSPAHVRVLYEPLPTGPPARRPAADAETSIDFVMVHAPSPAVVIALAGVTCVLSAVVAWLCGWRAKCRTVWPLPDTLWQERRARRAWLYGLWRVRVELQVAFSLALWWLVAGCFWYACHMPPAGLSSIPMSTSCMALASLLHAPCTPPVRLWYASCMPSVFLLCGPFMPPVTAPICPLYACCMSRVRRQDASSMAALCLLSVCCMPHACLMKTSASFLHLLTSLPPTCILLPHVPTVCYLLHVVCVPAPVCLQHASCMLCLAQT